MTYTSPSVFLASKALASQADKLTNKVKALSTPSEKSDESSKGNKKCTGRLRNDVSTSVIAPCIRSGSVRVFDMELNISIRKIINRCVIFKCFKLGSWNIERDVPVCSSISVEQAKCVCPLRCRKGVGKGSFSATIRSLYSLGL